MSSKRILSVMLILFSLVGASFGIKIGILEIVGDYTVSREEILESITKCREGNDITYADIDRDVFNIKDMGYFQEVKYSLSDYVDNSQILRFELIEYPVVKEIKLKISGPGLIPRKDLEKYISVDQYKALNYKRLIRTQNAIKNEYILAGYQLLEIKNNVEQYEGQIYLKDNILEIEVWEYGLYDFILKGETGDLKYEEIKELLDLRFLKDYYDDFFKLFLVKKNYYPTNSQLQMALSRIYNTGLIGPKTSIDFENLPEPLESGEHVTNLVITLQLNPVVPSNQPINSITVTGNTLVSYSELTNSLRSTYSTQTVLIDVLRDVQKIKAIYEKNGYPLVVITPRYYKESGELSFKISEAVLKDYRIQGLTKTREDLVKREISLKINEPIKMKDLRQSYINLNKTGYFSTINLEPLGLSANSTAVTILVKLTEMENNIEFKTNVTFDPKYGGDTIIQNIYGKIGLSLKNPMGQGQTIDVSTTLGKYPDITLGYNVSSVFKTPLDAGISVSYGRNFNQDRLEIDDPATETNPSTLVSFESERFTIRPNVSLRIDDFQKIGGDITWGKFKNFGFSTDNASYTDQIPKDGFTLVLGADYQYDRRDDLVSPNEGFIFKTRAEWSLPLDFVTEQWLRLNESISGFYSPWEDHIFAGRFISVQIPWEVGDPINYSIGGNSNVFIRGINFDRGFKGNYINTINLEYRFRFINTNNIAIEFGLFNDNSIGWNKFSEIANAKLYSSLGFGFRFNIPGFGVLRLDVPWDFSPSLISSQGPQWGGITFGYGQMF